MDLTKSNSETNFKVRILNFWLMSFLFFIYQEPGFLTSTAVAVSISSVGQKEVKQTEDTHFQRGMHNTKVGLYDHAITEFQEVLKLNPAHSAAFCQMGAVYRLKNMLNEAGDAYQHALTVPAIGNSHGVANLCLGMIYNSQGKFQRAERHGAESLNLQSNSIKRHFSWTKAWLKPTTDLDILGSNKIKQNKHLSPTKKQSKENHTIRLSITILPPLIAD